MNAKCYFIEVNLTIPKDIKFIPIGVKNKEGLVCFVTGNVNNVVINHVDYDELLKFNIIITKIH